MTDKSEAPKPEEAIPTCCGQTMVKGFPPPGMRYEQVPYACLTCGNFLGGAEPLPAPQEKIADKLQKRSDYLRKCFQDNPASMACLADELERQAKEIRDDVALPAVSPTHSFENTVQPALNALSLDSLKDMQVKIAERINELRGAVSPTPTKYDLSAIASEIQLEIQDGSSISQEFRDIVKILERHFGTEGR